MSVCSPDIIQAHLHLEQALAHLRRQFPDMEIYCDGFTAISDSAPVLALHAYSLDEMVKKLTETLPKQVLTG